MFFSSHNGMDVIITGKVNKPGSGPHQMSAL